MIANRQVGQSITLTFSVRKADGTPVDADVALTVRRPDLTDPAPTIDHPALGEYEATFGLTQAGLWAWRWIATGAATGADSGLLQVEAVRAPDLYVTPEELHARLASGANSAPIDRAKLTRACAAASRAVDNSCSAAKPGYRRFWLDPAPTIRRYVPTDPWELPVVDIATSAGLTVTVNGAAWTLDLDYQLAPVNAAADGRAWSALQALRSTWPAVLEAAPWTSLSGRRFARPPAAPSVTVTARHGWPAVPDPVREAATIQAIRLHKRPGAPFGLEGVSDFGPVRIVRLDPDIGPLVEHYSLGPVFA